MYQPGNQVAEFVLPVVYSSGDTRTPKKLYLTAPETEASAEWLN